MTVCFASCEMKIILKYKVLFSFDNDFTEFSRKISSLFLPLTQIYFTHGVKVEANAG